ncbi:MAG: hypothetical protein WD468_04975 [Pirellulales bacterium]
MQAIAIVVLSVALAVFYGIVHDQITARICIEYFTVGHPQILSVPTDSPTVLGFVWGVVATWWIGAGLGLPLAAAARLGTRPKVTVAQLIRPLAVVVIVAGICASVAGPIGFALARSSWITLRGPMAELVPPPHQAAFVADLFAHNASYLAGAIGGIALVVRTWRSRKVMRTESAS